MCVCVCVRVCVCVCVYICVCVCVCVCVYTHTHIHTHTEIKECIKRLRKTTSGKMSLLRSAAVQHCSMTTLNWNMTGGSGRTRLGQPCSTLSGQLPSETPSPIAMNPTIRSVDWSQLTSRRGGVGQLKIMLHSQQRSLKHLYKIV